MDAEQTLTAETALADAVLLSGSSFYFPAAADAAETAASLTTTTMAVAAKALSGSFSYCPAAAAVMVVDADANYRQQFFSSCLKSRL